MIRIGITGGIGSGKTYVCQLLQQRGIPVYQCDDEAKRLMTESPLSADALHSSSALRPTAPADSTNPSSPVTSLLTQATLNASTASSILLSVRTFYSGQNSNRTHPSSCRNVPSSLSQAFKTPSMSLSKSMPHSTCASNAPSNVTKPPLSRFRLVWHSRWTRKRSANVQTSASSTTAPPTLMHRSTNY